MIGTHALHLLRKDLGVGPRSPIFLYAIALPVILTLLIRVVFGSLFDPAPRLGIVDEGESQITRNARDIDGVQVKFPESAAALKQMVENNDLDAGLVLPTGFDGALQAGQMPNVQFFFGGQSLASNRVVLGVTMIDLIREVAGSPAPIEVETVTVGDGESVPLVSRLLPLIVLMAVLI
ncbi:MAG: ABC transporter permease, partial [Chloroflexota bacterium]|nr:ABC transporter permease [Chloroflexota bacterium]